MLTSTIAAYFSTFPEETARLEKLALQTKVDQNLFNRSNFAGHVTASALVFNSDMSAVLLILHKGLNRWLQPGGHVENDATLLDAALREVREETGLVHVQPHVWHEQNGGIPFDIDTHDIPARPEKGEPHHVHHDCLFLAIAGGDIAITLQAEEVSGAQWQSLDSLTTDPRLMRVYRHIQKRF